MTTALARRPSKRRVNFNLKTVGELECVQEWPETMDILSGDNFCIGSLKDNGHGCLLGHAACHFIPDMWPFQLRGAPLPPNIAYSVMYDHLVGDSDIEVIMEGSKVGRAFIKALKQAGTELTGIDQGNVPDINDQQPADSDWTKEDIKEHLEAVARIWNRALNIVGYDAGEPNRLKEVFAYTD